jgi:phosphocarrier protein HPr
MSNLTRSLKIKNRLGLHARAAGELVKVTSRFQSGIQVSKDGQAVDGKSILGLMMLAAAQGSEIEVAVSGDDADDAMRAIAELVERGFYEE